MLGSAMPREHTVTDQALTHVLTDDDEYLANLVAADGACASLNVFVSSHVERQSSDALASVSHLVLPSSQTISLCPIRSMLFCHSAT